MFKVIIIILFIYFYLFFSCWLFFCFLLLNVSHDILNALLWWFWLIWLSSLLKSILPIQILHVVLDLQFVYFTEYINISVVYLYKLDITIYDLEKENIASYIQMFKKKFLHNFWSCLVAFTSCIAQLSTVCTHIPNRKNP